MSKMNDNEIIPRLEQILHCDGVTCEICKGWLSYIIEALKEREK